jgi:pyruvate dehydrogenase E2 component (dihydrolipoamide acetyltransferase)
MSALFPDGTQAFSIRDVFAHLSVPVKIVVGAADRIIPAAHARGLPGTVAVHVFGAVGHMPHLEARAPVGQLLAEIVRAGG